MKVHVKYAVWTLPGVAKSLEVHREQNKSGKWNVFTKPDRKDFYCVLKCLKFLTLQAD